MGSTKQDGIDYEKSVHLALEESLVFSNPLREFKGQHTPVVWLEEQLEA